MKPTLRIILAVVTAAVVTACGRNEAAAPAVSIPEVNVAPPIERMVVDWDEFTARIEAVESVEVRPRVTGHLQAIGFQAGQLVKRGEVLFVIDPRWHRAALDTAEAQLQQAKVNLANAERDAERTLSLAKGAAALSGREADTRLTKLAAARAAVQAAEAARQTAALDLEATEVRSPIDGRVSRPLLTVGNYVSGVAGFTTLLTTVVGVDPVHVYAAVDEPSYLKHARLVRERKLVPNAEGKIPAETRVEGESDFAHKGWIESFDNRIDASTGSIVLRAVIPNPDGALMPGGFARLRIPASGAAPALLVDEKIIGTDQNQKFVLAVGPDNVAAYRPVTLGESFEGLRLVTGGVTSRDQLITSGLQMVRPGMPVAPRPVPPSGAVTAAR